jgi:hypothetical protein
VVRSNLKAVEQGTGSTRNDEKQPDSSASPEDDNLEDEPSWRHCYFKADPWIAGQWAANFVRDDSGFFDHRIFGMRSSPAFVDLRTWKGRASPVDR